MEFTLRDLVYIGIYVATVTGLFVKFKDQIQRVEKSMDTANKVIFLERGGLNVVTKADCIIHRDAIQQNAQDMLEMLHCCNQNVVKIMVDKGLEPVVMRPGNATKS